MKRTSLACGFILTLMALSVPVSAQEEEERVQVFEELAPIPDADPEIRHEEVFGIPARLLIGPGEAGTYVSFDSTSVRAVKVTVGRKMVVGCEWTLYYFDGTKKMELRRNLGASPEMLLGSGRMVFRGLEAIADSMGSLQLIAELTLFETDIPIQHMWNPKLGKYRPLWKGLATGVLTGSE